MTPISLMIVSGIVFNVFMAILLINFSMMWKKNISDTGMMVHAVSGIIAWISGIGLFAGFIWKMVEIIADSIAHH